MRFIGRFRIHECIPQLSCSTEAFDIYFKEPVELRVVPEAEFRILVVEIEMQSQKIQQLFARMRFLFMLESEWVLEDAASDHHTIDTVFFNKFHACLDRKSTRLNSSH